MLRTLNWNLIGLLLCAGLVLASPDSAGAADLTLAQAINKSGREQFTDQFPDLGWHVRFATFVLQPKAAN